MKKEIKKNTATSEPTKTSMSVTSGPICHDAECIGKLTTENSEVVDDSGKKEAESGNHSTQSSMKFGDKDSCSDEECIGLT
jgi:hypothetical protein